MTEIRAYISGMGVVSSLGTGVSETSATLQQNVSGIRPLRLFPTAGGSPLPVGEVLGQIQAGIPRTHHLAGLAADQAMEACDEIPDAVVLGVTTGGMPTTETLLKENIQNPELYRLHAIGSVAEEIARRYRCTGPVITVSTLSSLISEILLNTPAW